MKKILKIVGYSLIILFLCIVLNYAINHFFFGYKYYNLMPGFDPRTGSFNSSGQKMDSDIRKRIITGNLINISLITLGLCCIKQKINKAQLIICFIALIVISYYATRDITGLFISSAC